MDVLLHDCSPPIPKELGQRVGQVLGVYKNSAAESVYVTDNGLLVLNRGQFDWIPFDEIESAKVLGQDKWTADHIMVTTKNSTTHIVPIRHGHGKTRDVWEFWRFLDRSYKGVQSIKSPTTDRIASVSENSATYNTTEKRQIDSEDENPHGQT
jgi:hypothetical protein